MTGVFTSFSDPRGRQADDFRVPEALSRVVSGGTVVCAGIHMTDIPSFPYRLLWQERQLRSLTRLTRRDARQFLDLA